MSEARSLKKEKKQNIQVFVRVRPINSTEKRGKSRAIVEVPSKRDVFIRERPQASKKFTFDRVFGPTSNQIDVYNEVVSPLLEEVLAGYNCTIFAYGQTGTGKTFTMEGVSNDSNLDWRSDTTAGMIPRSLSHLFDVLQSTGIQEYTIRVSFLELYNEEIFDLLSADGDTTKIRLFEGASKKGSVIIQGLQEVTVHNKGEVYKILEKGSQKRQTAATLMNAHSSRSHTVFSVTVHIKEITADGKELLKTGKLNLVDLAGSENIGKSGAVDRRAREAGSINQSLLTLGRVITALVERTPHIPYRESKLTRLLQESLGGCTKTSIIATVSPARLNLEETLSTLAYAHRAKNITNRPEINRKLSKKALIKEYTEEIEKLRRDLLATREKNGVYLANTVYMAMQDLLSNQQKEMEEKLNHVKALEEAVLNKEKIFADLQSQHESQANELYKTKDKLHSVSHILTSASRELKLTELQRDEQKYLLEHLKSTERTLLSQAENVLEVVDVATTDTHKLHEKINRKTQVEEKNETVEKEFRNNLGRKLDSMQTEASNYTERLQQFCLSKKNELDARTNKLRENFDTSIQKITSDLVDRHSTATGNLTEDINTAHAFYQKLIEDIAKNTDGITEYERQKLTEISKTLAPKLCRFVDNEVADNLRLLNKNVSKKLNDISSEVKAKMDLACDKRLQDYDRLSKCITRMKEKLAKYHETQNESVQKQRAFAKVMDEAFQQFNILNQSEMESDGPSTSRLHSVKGICNEIANQVTRDCNSNIDLKKNLEAKIENDLALVKNDVAVETKKNVELSKQITDESSIFLSELQSSINEACDGLKLYQDISASNVQKIQEKMDDKKSKILLSVNEARETVLNVNSNLATLTKRQKSETVKACTEMGKKLANHRAESTELGNRLLEQLGTIDSKVDKFFTEDVQRDIATGSTPVKKEFSYPRQFAVTSPHDRIIQRFRAAKEAVGMSEDIDDTLIDDNETTIKENTDISTKSSADNI